MIVPEGQEDPLTFGIFLLRLFGVREQRAEPETSRGVQQDASCIKMNKYALCPYPGYAVMRSMCSMFPRPVDQVLQSGVIMTRVAQPR